MGSLSGITCMLSSLGLWGWFRGNWCGRWRKRWFVDPEMLKTGSVLIKLADLGLYVMLAVRQVTLAGEVTLAYSACLSCLFASKARPDRCRGNWLIIRWFCAACQFSYFEYLFPHYRTSLHLADYLLRILALLGMLCVIMQRDAGYRWRRTRLRAQFRLSLVQCWDYTHVRLPQLG